MPTLTIGGKPVPKPEPGITAAPRRVRPDTTTVPPDPDVNRDPYIVPPGLTVEERSSWLIDAAIQLEQGLDELAAIVRRARRIGERLNDPANAHIAGRDRREAVRAAAALDADIVGYVHAVLHDEAHADRYWQSLTPEYRVDYDVDYWWRTSPLTPRLIGRAWRGIGGQFAWPRGWRLPREAETGLPWVMVCDLNAAKVWSWVPNPRPAMFDGPAVETLIPHEIGSMLIDEKGNPR